MCVPPGGIPKNVPVAKIAAQKNFAAPFEGPPPKNIGGEKMGVGNPKLPKGTWPPPKIEES